MQVIYLDADTIWLDDASNMWELFGRMEKVPPQLFGMTEEASEGAPYSWYTIGGEGTGACIRLQLRCLPAAAAFYGETVCLTWYDACRNDCSYLQDLRRRTMGIGA